LREECRLKVVENRVLRRIFGPSMDEVTGEWRKLHNEELYDLYPSPNIFWVIKSRRMNWVGHVALMVERRVIYRVLVKKAEGKRTLRRHRGRWEGNINPLNAELNPICHFLALLGTHHIVHVSRIRVKMDLQVKSVMICVAETWSLYEDDSRRINATEKDVLR
jgi:hypothetical protein